MFDAIASLHKPWELYEMSSTALYDWRLRFYRGKLFLGEVGICGDMVLRCGTTEYQGPPILDELYNRITNENMESDDAANICKMTLPPVKSLLRQRGCPGTRCGCAVGLIMRCRVVLVTKWSKYGSLVSECPNRISEPQLDNHS